MTTECIHCNRKFKTFEAYAQHVLDKHSEDDIRVGWANEVLYVEEEEPITEDSSVEEPKDEIDAVLATLLRPEVLARLRGCTVEAPKEVPKPAKPKKAEKLPEKSKRGFHWPLIAVMGIIILILLFALCRLAY